MKKRVITKETLNHFTKHLLLQEKRPATIQKYLQINQAFFAFAGCRTISKEGVIAYKEPLQKTYSVRSVNAMPGAVNSLFSFWVGTNRR